MKFLLSSFLLIGSTLFAADDAIYIEAKATEKLREHEGKQVVVYGTTDGSGKSASGTNYVNFPGAEFHIVTFKSDLGPFEEEEPYQRYDGKKIAVTGTLAIFQRRPQIKLVGPEQIQVIAEGEAFPPESPVEVAVPEEESQTVEEEALEPTAPVEETPKVAPVDWRTYFQ